MDPVAKQIVGIGQASFVVEVNSTKPDRTGPVSASRLLTARALRSPGWKSVKEKGLG